MKRFFFFFVFVGLVSSTFAESMNGATSNTRRDMVKVQKQLASLENEVVKARSAMALKIVGLNGQIKAAKKRLVQLQKQKTLQLAGREISATIIAKAREDLDYLQTVAENYRESLDTRLSAAEVVALRGRLKLIDGLLSARRSDEKLRALKPLLELSFDRVESAVGGALFEGKAIGKGGDIEEGKFAKFGPVSYFSNSTVSGQVTSVAGELLPSIQVSDDPELTKAIESLVSGTKSVVPLDLSGGKAFELAKQKETLWVHLRKGGMIIYPLLALALVCLLVTFYKMWALGFVVSGNEEGEILLILKEVKAGNVDVALSLADKLKKPLGPVVCEGIKHQHLSKEHLEEILYECMLTQIPRLDRFLPALAVCASAAPLLGLLGTVTGMINTFKLITVFGTGDASLLSSGISEALVTTEVGLFIAIPTLLIHAWLSRRVRRATAMTQKFAIVFVNGLKIRPDGQD